MEKNHKKGIYVCKKCSDPMTIRFGFWLFCKNCSFYSERLNK